MPNMLKIFLLLSCHTVLNYGAIISQNSTRSASLKDVERDSLAISIDLRSCECLHVNENCELVIAKLNIMGLSCPESHQFCCNRREEPGNLAILKAIGLNDTKAFATDTMKTDQLNVSAGKSETNLPAINLTNTEPNHSSNTGEKVRMRILSVHDLAKETEPLTELGKEEKSLKSQFKCRCKPRSNCLEKHVDYSFGFHCSYDKVRCCEPDELIMKEMEEQLGGRLVIINQRALPKQFDSNQTDDSGETAYQRNSFQALDEDFAPDCLCLPENECNIKIVNEIGKRKDMACPFNYVQCCGSAITMSKSEYEDKTFENTEQFIPSEEQYIEGRGMAPHPVYGQSSFRQKPVQLPILIVPTESTPSSTQIQTSSPTTDQPPPSLPTYYQQSQPKSDQAGQIYYQQAIRKPIQRTQSYFTGRVIHVPSTHPQQTSYKYKSNNHKSHSASSVGPILISNSSSNSSRRRHSSDAIAKLSSEGAEGPLSSRFLALPSIRSSDSKTPGNSMDFLSWLIG